MKEADPDGDRTQQRPDEEQNVAPHGFPPDWVSRNVEARNLRGLMSGIIESCQPREDILRGTFKS